MRFRSTVVESSTSTFSIASAGGVEDRATPGRPSLLEPVDQVAGGVITGECRPEHQLAQYETVVLVGKRRLRASEVDERLVAVANRNPDRPTHGRSSRRSGRRTASSTALRTTADTERRDIDFVALSPN
jgi:hypothetical protein